jgi:Methyltransferase domain
MKFGALARGLATYVPGMARLHGHVTHTGGSDSARYCYSVWLRHLVMSNQNGLCARVPDRVAELGPGDSIGIGLAALLCGADRYYGLDALPLANLRRNLVVFDELVDLFRARASIPDETEFPGVKPKLRSYDYPEALLTVPDPDRIERIRSSIVYPTNPESMVRYVAPWWNPSVIESGGVNMIFSQAVLEHVNDLETAYSAMQAWLAPGGWLSHQIDFRSHGTAHEWNGHWTYGDRVWRLLRGHRAFLINREPHSTHVRLLREAGFTLVCDQTVPGCAIARHRLAQRFASLSDSDLTISGAFIQARRDAASRHESFGASTRSGSQ